MSRTLVIYMPAIHAGYIRLIEQVKPDAIHLISNRLASGLVPPLERDLRALEAKDVTKFLDSLFPDVKVKLLEQDNIRHVENSDEIVMPLEDISEKIAEKYLAATKVKYINTFLRWDMSSVDKEQEVKHTISDSAASRKYMELAVDLSHRSPDWWRQIGAVLVKEDKVLLKSFNQPYPNKDYSVEVLGDPKSNFGPGEKIELSKFIHAEALLISEAARKGIATEGCSLYVTTFPCPVCAKLVANAGIKNVYYKDGYSILDAEDIFRIKNVNLYLVR